MTPFATEMGRRLGRRPLVAIVAAAAALLVFGGVLYMAAGEKRPPAYSLVDVRGGAAQVPRTFLANLPAGALKEAGIAARKDIFVRTVLPLVLRGNETIRAERSRLLGLTERRRAGERLPRKERAWLSRLAKRYGGPEGDQVGDLAALARRVDVIPPSLALTQAAVESAWGTSRFAREGNALFGVRTFEGAPALVPNERDADAGFAVRRYNGLTDSVRGYIHTLNTHPAYRELRRLRAEMRARGGTVEARTLLPSLGGYAEDSGYLELLNEVMRDGRFWEFDQSSLADR